MGKNIETKKENRKSEHNDSFKEWPITPNRSTKKKQIPQGTPYSIFYSSTTPMIATTEQRESYVPKSIEKKSVVSDSYLNPTIENNPKFFAWENFEEVKRPSDSGYLNELLFFSFIQLSCFLNLYCRYIECNTL